MWKLSCFCWSLFLGFCCLLKTCLIITRFAKSNFVLTLDIDTLTDILRYRQQGYFIDRGDKPPYPMVSTSVWDILWVLLRYPERLLWTDL